MKPVIYRNIKRPDREVMNLLRDLGVATVHEAQGRTGLMKPYMRPIYASAKIGAPAVTAAALRNGRPAASRTSVKPRASTPR